MPTPSKISQERILAEAIALLREEGMDALTLRRLAARLDVEAPSLYRHVASKQQLLALVTVQLFRTQLDEIGTCRSWQEWVLRFGHTLWRTQRMIRDCARLVLTTDFSPKQLATMTDWVAAALTPHGIDRTTALEMQISVQAMVLGLSGLANGPNARVMRDMVPFDSSLDHALAALVIGWEARLGTGHAVDAA